MRADDGALSALARGEVQEVRIARPDAALSLRPAVEAVLGGTKAGRSNAELSYLTGGLSWSAEHSLVRTGENTGTWATSVTVDAQRIRGSARVRSQTAPETEAWTTRRPSAAGRVTWRMGLALAFFYVRRLNRGPTEAQPLSAAEEDALKRVIEDPGP